MKSILCILIVFGVIALGAAAFIWSGSYNVAATSPHWEATFFLLEKVRDRSIEAHSKDIVPPSLEEPKYLESGSHHYHPMCRLCHGAPGHPRSEFAQGLYPSPPNLAAKGLQGEWSDAEVYWIIKNGLKMTGMPAFGINHSEDELWGLVAFFRRLPDMKPEEYNLMVKPTDHRQGTDEADHHHGDHKHE